VYAAAALALGVLLIAEATKLLNRVRRGENPRPMRLFHWTNTYLTLLFLAVAVDVLIR
jgi:protoheme IX farnesyltransferase